MQIDGEIQIKDGSIPTTKLELPNDPTKFFNGVGEFVEVANNGEGGGTPGAKLLRFSGTVGDDGYIPPITNTMLGLDGIDLTTIKIIPIVTLNIDSVINSSMLQIFPTKVELPGMVLSSGSIWFATIAIEGNVSGESGSGALPSGTEGQVVRYNTAGELEATNLLKIVGTEFGGGYLEIGDSVDSPALTINQPYDANYPAVQINGSTGVGIRYEASPYSTILDIVGDNNATSIMKIYGSYSSTGRFTIELGGYSNAGRDKTVVTLPALAGETDRPLIVKADGSIDAGATAGFTGEKTVGAETWTFEDGRLISIS